MTGPAITARTLASAAAIEGLAAEWRELESATPEATGFQSPGWRLSCESGAATPRLVTVRENGRLVMLLPLQVGRTCAASVATWLGEPLAQYGDALALPSMRRPEWYRAADAEMIRWTDVDLLALTRLRADGVLAACGAPLTMADSEKLAAPFAELSEALRRRHKSVERRMKKLAQHGEIRFDTASGPQDRRDAAERALAFKLEWLRRRRSFSASLSSPAVRANLVALAEKGVLSAHRLWASDRLAAVDIGLQSGGVYRSLIGAYDDELADASPGHALTLHLLPVLAARGITRYDFLPPADPYKMIFATGASSIGTLYRPLNARGAAAAFVLARLRPLAKDALYAFTRAGLPIESVLHRLSVGGAKLPRTDSTWLSRRFLATLGANLTLNRAK